MVNRLKEVGVELKDHAQDLLRRVMV